MEEIPDKNIFMMCRTLNTEALSKLPDGYSIRSCRKDELGIWKAMPFDEPNEAEEYDQFMMEFFQTTYGGKEDLFYSRTLFVCDAWDRPVATCLLWKAYNEFNTIHWFKVLKDYEGFGIGRALLSIIMKNLNEEDYPVYLHTQPGSYRAIKLYSDFGFYLLSGDKFGSRQNDLEECLAILEKYMPEKDFRNLKISGAPEHFLNRLDTFDTIQF
ncbi:GNAT family N-acetyltransferase [Fulvivirgaceae bacterium BMA10]|uniref:GNAT family N-acetyltransferase n=1 Tax=Splendidivirga corallicola TaxID=3051826 RepID=A0ABT8KRF3_9BACT|nr:GNAT family N-acetyltransferase [Fulvivirgaceae bacterium BMA10]